MRLSIEILSKELKTYERCLIKSKELYLKGGLTDAEHNTHKNNLEPKIAGLSEDIEYLKKKHFELIEKFE